ncbi:MAG TPA: phosphatidate cytidylyltransferase [Terriglobales bacterium]|nr:phosphatidate cytidylyltransferase [Terriglobales bacterium]
MLKRIATAIVLIPVVLLLVLHASVPVLALTTSIIALLTARELLKLTEAYGVVPYYRATYVAVAAVFAILAIDAGQQKPLLSTGVFVYSAAFLACVVPFFFLALSMRRPDLSTAYPSAAASSFAFVYAALPLAFLVQLRQQPSGAIFIIYVLLVVWAGDIFAYFIGKSLGKNLLAPRISPKKTWEGAIASVAASVLIGTIFLRDSVQISTWLLNHGWIERRDGIFGLEKPEIWTVMILSLVLNIAAQFGDLVESLIKRGAGVKDSGAILPGHGGMLDRVDALLFAAPIMWIYASWRVLQ